jgi:hypothetical protein
VFYSGDTANKPAGPTACGDPSETVTISSKPSPDANQDPSSPKNGPKILRPKHKHKKPKHKRKHRVPSFTG